MGTDAHDDGGQLVLLVSSLQSEARTTLRGWSIFAPQSQSPRESGASRRAADVTATCSPSVTRAP